MPSALLPLLPLLGGYLFNHICHFFRFRAQALTGYRLVFEAAVTGAVLLIPARFLALSTQFALSHIPGGQWMVARWQELTSSTPLVGTAALAMAGGPILAALWNLWTAKGSRSIVSTHAGLAALGRAKWRASRSVALSRAIQRTGNELQRLLHDAAVRGHFDGTTIGLSMEDGKLYAGWVTKSPNLHPNDEWVAILPALSGFRHPETREVIYSEIYSVEDYDLRTAELDSVVTLPVDQIQSARLLDRRYYQDKVDELLRDEDASR